MKKILGLFILIFLVGCGIEVETEVQYKSDSDEVVLTSYLVFDEEDYGYIVGGKEAVEKALEDNLWEGAEIEEDSDDTYKIVTSFDSVDSYNDFMNDKIGEDGIYFESGVELLAVYKEYNFNPDTSEYLGDYISGVYNQLEYTDDTFTEDDLLGSHYVTNYYDDEMLYDSTYREKELYESSEAVIKVDIKEGSINKDKSKAKYETISVSLAVDVDKDDENYENIIAEFKEFGFKTDYKDGVLNLEIEYPGKMNGVKDVETIFADLECQVTDDGLFSSTFKCEFEDKYLADHNVVYVDEVDLSYDFEVEYSYEGKDITNKIGKSVKNYHTIRIVVAVLALLGMLAATILTIVFVKKKNKSNPKSDSNNVFRREFSASEFAQEKEEVSSKSTETILDKINGFIDIKLIVILLILTTPIYSISLGEEIIGMGGMKGSIFLNFDKDVMELLLSYGMSLAFVNGIKITLMVLTLCMVVRGVLTKLNILKLSSLINKIIDIVFYGLNIIAVVIFIVYLISNEWEQISISFAYIVLVVVATFGIIVSATGFKLKNDLDIYSKYFILLLLSVCLSMFYIAVEVKSFISIALDFNFNQWLIMMTSVGYGVVMALVLISALVFVILKLKIKFGYRFNGWFVIGHMILYVIGVIISLIVAGSELSGEESMDYIDIDISFGLTYVGFIYLFIVICMIVYVIFDFIIQSKVKKVSSFSSKESLVDNA